MPWKRRLSKAALLIPKVRYWEKQFLSSPTTSMLEKSMELRGKARGKWDLDKLLPEAFGLVASPSSGRSASARSTCSSRPASSCTTAGWSNWPPAKARRHGRRCPTFLNALAGKGVHVTTVNDYLAKRDAEWIGPVYQMLGLTVGVPPAEDGRRGPRPRRTGATSPTAPRPSSASTSSATG